MINRQGFRFLIGVTLICVAFGTLILAQSSAVRQAPTTMDDLLTELKGLRADMAQASSATIKTQLLVARLQVEEQRMNGIAKQIVDVQTQLAAVRHDVVATELGVKQTDDIINGRAANPFPEAIQKDFAAQLAAQLADFKSRLELQQRREQELAAQEGALSNQFASEQARWSDFNDRLDALERSLARR